MPGKKACSRILDPAERRKCENYQGKYASAGKGSRKGNRKRVPSRAPQY